MFFLPHTCVRDGSGSLVEAKSLFLLRCQSDHRSSWQRLLTTDFCQPTTADSAFKRPKKYLCHNKVCTNSLRLAFFDMKKIEICKNS